MLASRIILAHLATSALICAPKAAEEMIGGQLTQDRLMAALSNGRDKNINYTDQRRFNSGTSARDRREMYNETKTLLEDLVRN